MRITALSFLSVFLFSGVADTRADPAGNGRKGRKVFYKAESRCGDTARIRFSTEIEHILFVLNSVQNRYKVLRIHIENGCDQDLPLSGTDDRVDVQFAGRGVRGILDLRAVAPALWDSLDAAVRSLLVYPARVEPGEEESIFVFLPSSDVTGIPHGVRYELRSLPRPLELRDLTAAAH